LLTEIVKKKVKVMETQHGIIKYMEAMAQVMAAAAVASQQATGDMPVYAVGKWLDVVRKRALELIQQQKAEAKRPAPSDDGKYLLENLPDDPKVIVES
jgi:hypothetical protein